jgi:hypothetical protein
MTDSPPIALNSRAVIAVRGPDWRPFLQNLLTNDVESLAVGEARFTALLTPQGRLLYDLFVIAREDGAWLDVQAEWRDALIQRLTLYRLRAKVEIVALDLAVSASPVFGVNGLWVQDPRLPGLGWRGYGAEGSGPESLYDARRLLLGVPGPADWGTDKTYPIEANFDLLGGIDFHKGCFIGQETTSRMHRRGAVKTRMLPLVFDGPTPASGAEVLAGDLRAGEVLSGVHGRAMGLMRLDRIEGPLTVGGQPVRVETPAYFNSAHSRESGDPVL